MVRRIDSLLFYNLFIFMKNDINEKLSKCFIHIVLILFGNFKSIVIIFVMYLFLNSYKGYYKNYKFRLLIIFYKVKSKNYVLSLFLVKIVFKFFVFLCFVLFIV